MLSLNTRALVSAAVAMALAPAAFGQVNGARDAFEYGPALALQTIGTGFGNNFSELNGLFAKVLPDGSVRLMMTGNLEGNGNALVLFIDSKSGGGASTALAGGFRQMGSVGGSRTDDWGTDLDGGTGVSPTAGGGSVFSGGFNPDFSLEINAFAGAEYFTNIIDLNIPNEPNDNRDVYLGSGSLNTGTAVTQTYFRDGVTQTPSGTITHSFNNTNILGVSGFGDPATDPDSATTGLEYEFSSQFLNADPGEETRILPLITNGDGGFLANQFLPGLPSVNNLGGPGGDGGTPLFDSQVFIGYNSFVVLPVAEWIAGGAGGWANDANWLLANPNGVNVTAKFGTFASSTLVNVTADKTLGGMIFDNAVTPYTLTGANTLTLQAFAGKQARVNVRSGSHVITAPVQVNSNLRVSVAAGSNMQMTNMSYGAGVSVLKDGTGSATLNRVIAQGLTVSEGRLAMSGIRSAANSSQVASVTIAGATDAWLATLDTNANDMVIDYTGSSPLATVQNQIKSGYNAGPWNGPGITTDAGATAAITSDKTGIGYADDGDKISLVYTLFGDATLDRSVNGADFNLLLSNFGQAGTAWATGDFTYDGNTNGADFNALAANFGKALASGPGASVPEPTGLALLGLGSLMALRRRR